MKKLFTFIFAVSAFVSVNAQLLVEDFSYVVGDSLSLPGTGWNSHSGAGFNNILVVADNLSYAGYTNSTTLTGKAVKVQNSDGQDVSKNLSAAVNSGAIYASFLIRVDTIGTGLGNYFFHFKPSSSATTFGARTFARASAGGYEMGISKASGTGVYAASPKQLTIGTTYLIVVKYQFNPGGTNDDVVSLYINPSPTNIEPATAEVTVGAGLTGDLSTIDQVSLRQSAATTNQTPECIIDALRVATTYSVVIPVEMVAFSAKKAGTTNKLAWQTATELNNERFDVQRSNDGATFQNIGQVKGAGTSNSVNNYEFMDETPAVGTNYYRLQQVDANGKTTTSKTVAVNASGKGSVKVFPTLATDKINVLTTSDKAETFEIVNLVGQTVLTGRLTNASEVSISQLAKGNYILKIAGDAVKFSKQ